MGMLVMTKATVLGEPPVGEAGIQICLLGSFQILKRGRPISIRTGGKVERLIANLALSEHQGVGREELMGLVWPGVDYDLARQSLNTLVHSLSRTLSDALAGYPPVLHPAGRYHLNVEHGVGIDVSQFDAAVTTADHLRRAGDRVGAIRAYHHAIELYGGDLAVGSAIQHLLERERLRARFLSVLARLADVSFADEDYEGTLESALRLLGYDPCREDAHRMVMRCHVRLGQRAQALRQYRICQQALALEFEASPEGATDDLYRLIRLNPGLV
jgi:DNA-binding SARP family transcriptional activator